MNPQVHLVTSFQKLVQTSFNGSVNAMAWKRQLQGDFEEVLRQFPFTGNMITIEPESLLQLHLSDNGQQAREAILNDWNLLQQHGAQPVLNLISHYERDEQSIFPTDVYSFHVDRSPVATDTFLCTYFGASSQIISNEGCERMIDVPEIRAALQEEYGGEESGFEQFLMEHFYDLHYRAKPNATPFHLGNGWLWRLAIDHPEQQVPPCIHRAPIENGQPRLLLIC